VQAFIERTRMTARKPGRRDNALGHSPGRDGHDCLGKSLVPFIESC